MQVGGNDLLACMEPETPTTEIFRLGPCPTQSGGQISNTIIGSSSERSCCDRGEVQSWFALRTMTMRPVCSIRTTSPRA